MQGLERMMAVNHSMGGDGNLFPQNSKIGSKGQPKTYRNIIRKTYFTFQTMIKDYMKSYSTPMHENSMCDMCGQFGAIYKTNTLKACYKKECKSKL